jgi:glycosyltransferase involved in cell wall biosynthesis
MKEVGVVVIGRNEGERLKTCLHSLKTADLRIVYVDSGSSDDSVLFAREKGCDVVELDMSQPFSAARARNEGYRLLLQQYDDVDYVQFVDGDCEVYQGWITSAYEYLQKHTYLASVCGRRRERYPETTFYNQLCDIEWNTPIGITMATGGDFMCRKQALIDVSGFSPEVIAGEEPEMCFRMRQQGWQIERLDLDMTLHDANMTNFSQWWKRCERSGHAYAQGFFMHGCSDEKYYRADVLRIVLWALLIPLVVLLGLPFFGAWSFLLLLIYPVKVIQIAIRERKVFGGAVALVYAGSLVLGKFPQMVGIISFCFKKITGQKFQIIEYKNNF